MPLLSVNSESVLAFIVSKWGREKPFSYFAKLAAMEVSG